VVSLLTQHVDGVENSDEDFAVHSRFLGVGPDDLEDRLEPPPAPVAADVDESAPTILFTSMMGSKGLQAAHVFVVGMNDEHFPRDNDAPTNEEVCQLLVTLTRARKSCTLLSVGRLGAEQKRRSVFLSWLQPHTSNTEYVNKDVIDNLAQ
jgi:superfamily I DNA/RNA helicase